MSRPARWARPRSALRIRLAAAALLLPLVGCALLPATAPPPGAPAGTAARTAAPPRLEVQAPSTLRALLLRHLDLARLAQMAADDPSIGDAEWSRLIDATPAQARELLQTEGYFAAKVSVQRDAAVPGTVPERVLVVVDPGARATVAHVTVDVQSELGGAASAGDDTASALLRDLQRDWPLPVGREFINADWGDAKARTLSRLRAAGYAAASWSGTAAEVDVPTNSVRLAVIADSGPLFRSGELQIEGLAVHDAATVRNLANFGAGTPVTESLLLDFQERLQGAGLFDSATVTFEPDPAQSERTRILVRVHEAVQQVYTIAVGVSANTGPRASVEHVYRRVFGYAATARNKIELGGLRQAWDGELSTHTQPGLYRNLLGGALERLQSDTDTVLSQRLRLGRAHDQKRLERLSFVEFERSQRKTDLLSETALALSLNQHLVYRQVDSAILPTTGYTLALQGGAGVSHATDANNGVFGRLYGRLTYYRPIGRDWFGQARIELGQVFLGDGVKAPESQRFRVGGDDSVRGYAYRSLGPLVNGAAGSGNLMFTASAEVARPILERIPALWGAVFVDVGAAADSWGAMEPALGVGVGLRFRSPVGPLRLDLAWGQQVQRFRLHFSVGIAL